MRELARRPARDQAPVAIGDGLAARELPNVAARDPFRLAHPSGYFGRRMTELGRMIDKVLRITELSVTAGAKHPLTEFSVAEVKALGATGGSDFDWNRTELRLIAVEAQALGERAALYAELGVL